MRFSTSWSTMTAIVDYRAGNLTSVRLAFEALGEDAVVETCKKYLALPLEDNGFPGFGYRIGIRDIHTRSHDLFRELVPKQE